MNDMYQVRTYIVGPSVRSRRPIFNTVQAENASEAKRKVREALERENPDVQIKRISAAPVF